MITIRKARTIIKTTLAKGKELDMKPLSVIVLDAGGNILAFEREDGASPGRFQIAYGKAYGTVMLGLPGSMQNARAEAQSYFMTAMNGAYQGRVVPVQGGILVRDKKGTVVGAIGVTGDSSENDALAGMSGVTAAGLVGED